MSSAVNATEKLLESSERLEDEKWYNDNYGSWGRKESDTTEWLNWTELIRNKMSRWLVNVHSLMEWIYNQGEKVSLS